MLVSAIVRRVRESAGDLNVLQFSQQVLTDWINDGIRECVLEHSLLQTRAGSSTAVGQADYTLPPGLFKFHSVKCDDERIELITFEQFEERNLDPEATGTPSISYKYADVLTLWPTPDDVYSLVLSYTKLPTLIQYADTPAELWTPDTPPINEAYHNRLVAYCLAQVALQDEDNFKYNMLMQEFKTGVREIDINTEDNLYPFISMSARDMD